MRREGDDRGRRNEKHGVNYEAQCIVYGLKIKH